MERVLLKITILLDNVSRGKLRVHVADLLPYDVRIINSLQDLTPQSIEEGRRIVILEDYLRQGNSYADLKLYKSVFNLEYIFIAMDQLILDLARPIGSCYNMDPTLIDYEHLYSVVYEDIALQQRFLPDSINLSDVERSARMIVSSGQVETEVRKVAENFLSFKSIFDSIKLEMQHKDSLVSSMEIKLQQATEYAETINNMYIDLVANAQNLNRVLKQYESILSRDIYERVILSQYINRPKIIYLKEFQELIHMESFLSTLFATFRNQYRQSVKVLRLYDSSGSKRLLTLPTSKYVILKNKFLHRDVISNDFIAKSGNYKEIFTVLLNNDNALDLLIVVDCRDHADTVLSGQYLQLSLCRNPKNIAEFGLDALSTIVNNQKDNAMSWNYYPEYANLNDEELFLFLSSRPVIQTVYELTKLYAEIGG